MKSKPSSQLFKMLVFLICASILIIVSLTIIRVARAVALDANCLEYLERASKTSSIDLAKEDLGVAIQYLESRNLTKGHTSIMWTTPNDDIGFWYENLKSSYQSLDNLDKDLSELEKRNALLKLREGLIEDVIGEEQVRKPWGISIYPYNSLFLRLYIFAIMLPIIFLIFLRILLGIRKKSQKQS